MNAISRTLCGLAAAAVSGVAGTAFAGVFTGSPGNVVTLTLTAPGTYSFSEDYNWTDADVVGDWASLTNDYAAGQGNMPNTLDLTPATGTIVQYNFVIPVDISDLSSIAFTGTARGGVTLRYGKDYSDLYTHDYLTLSGTNSYETQSVTVLPADFSHLDSSTPGQAAFFFRVQNESASGFGSIDNITITATAVPEPMALSTLALGAAALLRRRR
jgi:MYXO-CTERM domain-containing protein